MNTCISLSEPDAPALASRSFNFFSAAASFCLALSSSDQSNIDIITAYDKES
jgi:hypothetical protein